MSYTVAEEFILLREGAAVHYSDIGSTVDLTDAEAAELIEAGKIAVPHAIEAPADGTFTELVSEDTGGPYETLPEIENYDGTEPLEPHEAKPARGRRGEDSSES